MGLRDYVCWDAYHSSGSVGYFWFSNHDRPFLRNSSNGKWYIANSARFSTISISFTMDNNVGATGYIIFWLWACNAQIIGSCSAVTVLCFRITDWCFLKFYFYCVYFGINSSNLFGNFHSICRFVIVGLHDKKRYLGMGCLSNNGRNWYNHSVDYKYFLRVASSYVCDFHYWITCVCRPYCIRHSKH